MLLPKLNYSFISGALVISSASSVSAMMVMDGYLNETFEGLWSEIERILDNLGLNSAIGKGAKLIGGTTKEGVEATFSILEEVKNGIIKVGGKIVEGVKGAATINSSTLTKIIEFIGFIPEIFKIFLNGMGSDEKGINSEKAFQVIKNKSFGDLLVSLFTLGANKDVLGEINAEDVRKIAEALVRGGTDEEIRKNIEKMQKAAQELKSDTETKTKEEVIKKLISAVEFKDVLNAVIGYLINSATGQGDSNKDKIKNISENLVSISSNFFSLFNLFKVFKGSQTQRQE